MMKQTKILAHQFGFVGSSQKQASSAASDDERGRHEALISMVHELQLSGDLASSDLMSTGYATTS
jgi:hypothetical protein